MQKPKFKVEFLEEAAEFLDSLDEKVRENHLQHYKSEVFE
jgi:hypothetical protein